MRIELSRVQRPSILWLLRALHVIVAPNVHAEVILLPDLLYRPIFRILDLRSNILLALEYRFRLQRTAACVSFGLSSDLPYFVLRLLVAPDEDVSVERPLVINDLCDELSYVGNVREGVFDVSCSGDSMGFRRYETIFRLFFVFWECKYRPS